MKQLNYINVKENLGSVNSFTTSDTLPVGTVISFLGSFPPETYLICDGKEYDIIDYPGLSSFFEKHFGTVNHFGGDGVTTFAVPDFRNLFLRGYHGDLDESEQLSGDIGERQEATSHMYLYGGPAAFYFPTMDETNSPLEYDTSTPIQSTCKRISASNTSSETMRQYYTSRPVNSAVLYCIKAIEVIPLQDIYTHEEQVIGRWIDGKLIYQKTFSGISPNNNKVTPFEDITELSVDTVVELKGITDSTLQTGIVSLPCTRENTTLFLIGVSPDKKKLNAFVGSESFYSKPFHCTLKYTKTTDQLEV